MIERLPVKAVLCGREYQLRNNGNWYEAYKVLCIFNDDSLSSGQKWVAAIITMFPDYVGIFECSNVFHEACEIIKYFIDKGRCGDTERQCDDGVSISFFRDMELIIESLNVSKDRDIRSTYMHWWTFLGDVCNHAPTGVYKTVLEIRYKLNNNISLETWERKFYSHNRSIVDLPKLHDDEISFLNNLLGIVNS